MAKKVEVAEIQKVDVVWANIKIKGTSPMIMHRWAEKVKKEMLDKQMKKTVKKMPKDPDAQYEGSKYLTSDKKPAFPADGFKAAMIRGAKKLGLVMVDMKTSFFIHGEYSERDNRQLVPVKGKYEMREDMVRISGGVSDIRYRAMVQNWEAELEIEYDKNAVSFDQLVNMLNSAGFGVGVGEWRPTTGGIFGRFEVVT